MANDLEVTVIALALITLLVLQANMVLFPGYASNGNETRPTSDIQKTIVLGEAGWDNGSPSGIAINQKTNLIYVANRNSDTVTVVNASMNNVVEKISVGFAPSDVVVNPNTNFIYVTKINVGTVTLIDGSTNKVVDTLELDNSSQFYSEGGIAINEMTNEIYVLTNNYSEEGNYASISIIDGLTNKLQQSFKVADLRWDYDVGDSARDIILNSKTNNVYVVLMFGDLYVIDGSTKTESDKITIGYEKTPHQVNVNEETNMAYVSNFNNQSISVIDGSTNELIKTVQVGIDPQGIAIDTATNTIYVVTYGQEVAVVDGATHDVKGKIPVGEFPERAALNKNNGLLYVTNTGSNSISVIDTVDPAIPEFGSIAILITAISLLIVVFTSNRLGRSR
jgi:YVTN family beta-propeller protein